MDRFWGCLSAARIPGGKIDGCLVESGISCCSQSQHGSGFDVAKWLCVNLYSRSIFPRCYERSSSDAVWEPTLYTAWFVLHKKTWAVAVLSFLWLCQQTRLLHLPACWPRSMESHGEGLAFSGGKGPLQKAVIEPAPRSVVFSWVRGYDCFKRLLSFRRGKLSGFPVPSVN